MNSIPESILNIILQGCQAVAAELIEKGKSVPASISFFTLKSGRPVLLNSVSAPGPALSPVLVRAMLTQRIADIVVFIHEAWQAIGDDRSKLPRSLADLPPDKRQEVVLILVYTRDEERISANVIQRNPNKLIPSPFYPIETGDFTGRLSIHGD